MIYFLHLERAARSVIPALLLAATGLSPAAAFTNCSDSPAPGVNWTRCVLGDVAYENVNMTGAQLISARLERSSFDGSNFTDARARSVKLVSASLKNTVFDRADLQDADLTRADLEGASFKDARLRRTRLYRANLRGADFSGATLEGAELLHADLTGARWTDGERICAEGSIGRCN